MKLVLNIRNGLVPIKALLDLLEQRLLLPSFFFLVGECSVAPSTLKIQKRSLRDSHTLHLCQPFDYLIPFTVQLSNSWVHLNAH